MLGRLSRGMMEISSLIKDLTQVFVISQVMAS
jgi:hypothetical protein